MIDLKYYKICATSCSLEVQPNPPLQTQSQGIERKTVVNHPDQLDTIFFLKLWSTLINWTRLSKQESQSPISPQIPPLSIPNKIWSIFQIKRLSYQWTNKTFNQYLISNMPQISGQPRQKPNFYNFMFSRTMASKLCLFLFVAWLHSSPNCINFIKMIFAERNPNVFQFISCKNGQLIFCTDGCCV